MAESIELRIQTSKMRQLDIGMSQTERFNLGNSVPVPVRDYERLINKPQINGVELIGNKTSSDLLLPEYIAITDNEIEGILQEVFT